MKISFQKIWDEQKVLFLGCITVLILWFPVGFVHELGHVIICENNGYDHTLLIEGLTLKVNCSETPQPLWLYWALGGVFGIIVSSLPLGIQKIRNKRWLVLGLLILISSQAINGFSETFLHVWYMDPASNWSISIIGSIVILLLVLKYGMPKKTSHK